MSKLLASFCIVRIVIGGDVFAANLPELVSPVVWPPHLHRSAPAEDVEVQDTAGRDVFLSTIDSLLGCPLRIGRRVDDRRAEYVYEHASKSLQRESRFHLAYALRLLERGRRVDAIEVLEEAMFQADEWGEPNFDAWRMLVLLRIQRTTTDPSQVPEAVSKLELFTNYLLSTPPGKYDRDAVLQENAVWIGRVTALLDGPLDQRVRSRIDVRQLGRRIVARLPDGVRPLFDAGRSATAGEFTSLLASRSRQIEDWRAREEAARASGERGRRTVNAVRDSRSGRQRQVVYDSHGAVVGRRAVPLRAPIGGPFSLPRVSDRIHRGHVDRSHSQFSRIEYSHHQMPTYQRAFSPETYLPFDRMQHRERLFESLNARALAREIRARRNDDGATPGTRVPSVRD